MILIQLFIPNCSLAVPSLPRHNSKLFSNSFKQPTTASSNIHNNQDIFQAGKCYNQREKVHKVSVLWGREGDDAGGGLTLMGSGVGTLQLSIGSNARRLNNNLSTTSPARHMLPLQRPLPSYVLYSADSRKLPHLLRFQNH